VTVPGPEVLAHVSPGATTYEEVLALCGRPSEELERHRSPAVRTLVYKGTRRTPQYRWRLGPLAAVEHWDEEHQEVHIDVENDRVSSVQSRVRRVQA
jgi:hypothetical protein